MVNLNKAYSSREIIKILKSDGWVHKNTEGDHFHFVHPTKKGKGFRASSQERLKTENDKKHLRAGGADLSLASPKEVNHI